MLSAMGTDSRLRIVQLLLLRAPTDSFVVGGIDRDLDIASSILSNLGIHLLAVPMSVKRP